MRRKYRTRCNCKISPIGVSFNRFPIPPRPRGLNSRREAVQQVKKLDKQILPKNQISPFLHALSPSRFGSDASSHRKPAGAAGVWLLFCFAVTALQRIVPQTIIFLKDRVRINAGWLLNSPMRPGV